MDGKVLRSTKSRTKRRGGKPGTTQTLLKTKTRTMQRRAACRNVAAKENCGSTAESMRHDLVASASAGFVSKPQKACSDLACKENMLDPTEGLVSLLQANNGPVLKPNPTQQQQQSQQQQQNFAAPLNNASYGNIQGNNPEMNQQDCYIFTPVATTTTVGNAASHLTPQTECSTRLSQLNLEMIPFPTHFLSPPSDSPSPPNLNQQQKSCKIRISSLLGGAEHPTLPRCPLPNLQWTSADMLWQTMRSKDVSKATPEVELLSRHPGILSSMRIILLDWMMEVCEEYRLHRETYYLAIDLFDRFMDARTSVKKEQLQLLGVTCLFLAAKIEEIYPPKAAEFAYVTDGACSVEDILDTELIVSKILNWKLNHVTVTPSTWVNTYMQLGSHHLRPTGVKARDFDYPAYSGTEFSRIMKLLDLCSLDVSSRKFGSSVLAASAIYLQSERSRNNLSIMTGYELKDIQACVNWMHPCAIILGQKPLLAQKTFSGVPPHDTHNIQTHCIVISMLEDAMELRKSQESGNSQYMLLQDCSILMTPPRTERRCLAPINTSC